MKTFTKSDFIEAMERDTKISKADCVRAFESVIKASVQALADHKAITLRGFGSLTPVMRKAKLGQKIDRHTHTAEKVVIPAQMYVKFKPYEDMIKAVRGEEVPKEELNQSSNPY